jgi:hypothetical protein
MSQEELALQAEATARTNAKKTANAVITVEAEEIPDAVVAVTSNNALPAGGVFRGTQIAKLKVQTRTRQYPAFKPDNITPHTFANQTYWLVNYLDRVFTTNDEKFIKAREIGDLYEVTLKERSVGTNVYLDLVDYTTNSEMDAFEQNEARREALNDARAMSKKRLELVNSLSTAHAPTNDLLMNKLLQDFNG